MFPVGSIVLNEVKIKHELQKMKFHLENPCNKFVEGDCEFDVNSAWTDKLNETDDQFDETQAYFFQFSYFYLSVFTSVILHRIDHCCPCRPIRLHQCCKNRHCRIHLEVANRQLG